MARKSRPARGSKLLVQMSRNPKADWRIEQLETVARAHDINVRKGRGSHVIFEHPASDRLSRYQRADQSSRSMCEGSSV